MPVKNKLTSILLKNTILECVLQILNLMPCYFNAES